ncbi:unnamed protein product [Caenorhabditis sp. 36 PRJEB53466]|nr:unnamed protein product [Caenorhabditis sp. 36 PRJEB53466]
MNSRCEYLLQYFGDRYILLKNEWLKTCVDFLHNRVPESNSFTDEKFANLVFEQWTFSNFESTSFPVFGNHGICPDVKKQELQGPIVCQVNSFIDTGSPLYAQFCSMNRSVKEDNTGFEKIFHEKEEDYDTKPSRLLKLTLTDGESSLKAIEFWKCPQLSLHCAPGVKILIQPPCLIRNGTFLLKHNNCKLLGGQVLPLLNCRRPLDQYARTLGIKNFKTANTAVEPRKSLTSVPSTSTYSNPGPSAPAPVPRVPPGPSANISRYFTKKQLDCAPSTSRANDKDDRNVSPDIFADCDDDDDNMDDSFDNFETNPHSESAKRSTPSRSIDNMVFMNSVMRRMDGEAEDYETSRTPTTTTRKRVSAVTPPTASTSRSPGLLSSRQTDPRDEMLENMIESDEEPVKSPEKSFRSKNNPFKKQEPPPRKMIKVEEDSDDDIQIIEVVKTSSTSSKSTINDFVKERKRKQDEEAEAKEREKRKNVEKEKENCKKIEEELKEEEKEKEIVSPEEQAALKAFSKLKLTSLMESKRKMKYSIGSKRFNLLAIIESIIEPLRVVDNLWTMKVNLMDDSDKVLAYIDNQTLANLVGYTCEEAITVRQSPDLEKRMDGKRRLEALKEQLNRLDLLFEVEFFAGSSSCPVIRSIRTLCEQIDVY